MLSLWQRLPIIVRAVIAGLAVSGAMRQERESPPNFMSGGLFASLYVGSPGRTFHRTAQAFLEAMGA
jgi:hypothetical protein